jgi:hypothetical protein
MSPNAGDGLATKAKAVAQSWPTPTATFQNKQSSPLHRRGEGLEITVRRMTGIQWPTPTAVQYGYNQKTQDGYSEAPRLSLESLAKKFPTPLASKANKTGARDLGSKGDESLNVVAANWGTPRASDWKDGACAAQNVPTAGYLSRQAPRWTSDQLSPPDPMTATDGHTCGPQCQVLNPQFVEWLQNWPAGWTKLSPIEPLDYASWEMASSLSLQRLLSRYLPSEPTSRSL